MPQQRIWIQEYLVPKRDTATAGAASDKGPNQRGFKEDRGFIDWLGLLALDVRAPPIACWMSGRFAFFIAPVNLGGRAATQHHRRRAGRE